MDTTILKAIGLRAISTANWHIHTSNSCFRKWAGRARQSLHRGVQPNQFAG